MKILVAPLNWGLGHATRCVPLIRQWLKEGHEVVIGGDGESLIWLYRYFPSLRFVELAPLQLTYSRSNSQVGAILKALPSLIRFIIEDHQRLKILTQQEPWDLIVSDNRFGLWSNKVKSIYITHQLTIALPRSWRWLEPLARTIHARFHRHFQEIWVPDYEAAADSLAGRLSHPKKLLPKVRYIGPLSRFQEVTLNPPSGRASLLVSPTYTTVCLLSGLEPQRSILEEELIKRYETSETPVLIVRGKVTEPFIVLQHKNITLVPYLEDAALVPLLQKAEHIVCRSGYSSVMDFTVLGLTDKTEWIPTPGQPEQEYLASLLNLKRKVRQ